MNYNINELQDYLKNNNIAFIKDFDLSKRSWIKCGGVIKTFIKPRSVKEINYVLLYLNQKNINYYIIGNISNTIIRDGEINTPFINLNSLSKIKKLNNKNGLHIYSDSGVSIPVFSKYVINQGYSGTQGLYGIPGSIGGGIFMNASSFKNYLTQNIRKIIVIDSNQKMKIVRKKEANFSWRNSIFQSQKSIILGAYFYFPIENKKNKSLIETQFNKLLHLRKKYQEKTFPNLGSLFATKNIYSDIKYTSVIFFLLFLNYKVINLIFFNRFFKIDLNKMRSLLNSLYIKSLKLNNNSDFSLSERTINCLINKGTAKSAEGIKLIRKFQKITKFKIKLENVILDKIL